MSCGSISSWAAARDTIINHLEIGTNPMQAHKTREELRSKVIEAFAAQEEIFQICFFGREVEGKHDCYSDIDMVVYSSDPAHTQAHYAEVFASISPIRATFSLGGTQDAFSEMIMLWDYSPYQKVDFSIGGKQDWQRAVVYDDREKTRVSRSQLSSRPVRSDVVYKLTDVLFSVARFTKCLFRRDIDMYRRWVSITDLTLNMLYEKHFGWNPETLPRKLGGYETQHLYEHLDPNEKKQIDAIRPLDATMDLASSYQASIDLFIELSEQKAKHFGVKVDRDFISYIKEFMDLEIHRYQKQKAA
jgi:predicted nucleotidyltransferase